MYKVGEETSPDCRRYLFGLSNELLIHLKHTDESYALAIKSPRLQVAKNASHKPANQQDADRFEQGLKDLNNI